MKTTTIEILESDHLTWKRCCKKKGKSSKMTFHDLINKINNKILFENYIKTLSTRNDFKKPLTGCKIKKYKKTIEKKGSLFA